MHRERTQPLHFRRRLREIAFQLAQLQPVSGIQPDGIDDAAVRSYLLNEFNLEIGAGLGQFAGNAWRIGLMGFAARKENVALCLTGLAEAIKQAK